MASLNIAPEMLDMRALQTPAYLSSDHHKICLATVDDDIFLLEAGSQKSLIGDSQYILSRKGNMVFQPLNTCCAINLICLNTVPPADQIRNNHRDCYQ